MSFRMDVIARPGQVIGQFAVGSAPPTASTYQHRRATSKRPIAETEPEAEFVFDVEGEMELEEANTSYSQYIQPATGKRRTVVCKHWLRGLCKKGEMCDYLHEYDEDKMPVCQFYFSETVGARPSHVPPSTSTLRSRQPPPAVRAGRMLLFCS